MVGSKRAELASSSLDGSSFTAGYPSGPRGAYSSSSLERPGSFRESLESRLMVSSSAVSRNAYTTLDIPPLSQYLSLEPFPTTELNLKYSRQGELRRALGVSVEEHSFGSMQSKPLPPIASEDLKRFKASVLETSTRAKDRAKMLQDSILKLDKYRNLVTKRRRNEAQSVEKPGVSNSSRMGIQIHQASSDIASARPEERSKLAIPNRRARSSVTESEGRTILARQSVALDKDKHFLFEKDKSMLRACHGGSMSSDEKIRGLPTGGDGWEKKLKRRRSVGTMVTRIPDGDRELKQAVQPRLTDPRLRPSDCNGFRAGSANGIIGSNKIESSSQICSNSSRIIPRTEIDNGSLPSDRRDRFSGPDKERIAKGSKRSNSREDPQPESQSPVAKGKASRTSRSGSGILVSAPNYPCLSAGIEAWEQSPSLNKVQPLSSPGNRKRPLPAGSSSPVTQWVGQRPQKISRTRRANVVSPVSNFDDVQAFPEVFSIPDVGARLSSVDSGSGLNSRVVANGCHQLKTRLDNTPSLSGFSESEESDIIENKRERVDSTEVEDELPNAPIKMSDFNLPTKKNKVCSKDEIRDGAWRQGRSGPSPTQSRASLALAKEKLEGADTTKPLKNGRPASDRSESRVGRPPSKKASDRKAFGRPVPNLHCSSSDFTGESLDDREELVAAANAARNSSYNACSSSFWKMMESSFAFITSEDLTFLKHQIKFADELDASISSILDPEHNAKEMTLSGADSSMHSNFFVEKSSQTKFLGKNSLLEIVGVVDHRQARKTERESWFDKIIPLSQRLFSALIMEDGTENFDCRSEQEELLLQISSDCSIGTNCYLENEFALVDGKPDFLDMEILKKDCAAGGNSCSGFVTQTSISSCDLFQENGVSEHIDTETFPEYGHCNSQILQFSSSGLSSNNFAYEGQFQHMSLDDRILLELHSIGLYPDLVSGLAEGEDEEIDNAISDLKVKFFQQVTKKKTQLHKLDRALQGVKDGQERNLEQLAMHKLVEMAYKKLMGGRHGSSNKSAVSKISKQFALEFAKRTLIRCQKFEEIGQSCFNEPPLQDVLFSVLNQNTHIKYSDGLPLNNSDRHRGQFVPFQGPSNPSEKLLGKIDPISNRVKKKEALLDDVVTSAASRAASTTYNPVLVGPKWKKHEKDKDHSRDMQVKTPGAKIGRPSLSGGRGERKTKMKPKQKIAQLSTSGNGLSRPCEASTLTSVQELSRGNADRFESQAYSAKDIEESIFTNLPLNGMAIDVLDVAEGLGGQGQEDISVWLNVDEDLLQDHDLVGLEIPMDDLSDLKLTF